MMISNIQILFWLVLNVIIEKSIEATFCKVDIQAFGALDSVTSGHIKVNDVTYLQTDENDFGIYFAQLITCKGVCRIIGGIQHFDIASSSAESSACKDYINSLIDDTFILSVTASDTWGDGLHAGTCLDELEARGLVQTVPYGVNSSVAFVSKVNDNTENVQNQTASGATIKATILANINTSSVPENCVWRWTEQVDPVIDVDVNTLNTLDAPLSNPILICARTCGESGQCRSFHISQETGQCILYDGTSPNDFKDSYFFMLV
ncbi:unnamed protein product [Owenia fusiformis]|uniref:Apple domain-containing protein n=1 Tax=Owenia fusiformis TaxID=6347 RepID=A0A8S4NLD3_OWEFU|nr:unnamed protein product [Owenia fusiformis]